VEGQQFRKGSNNPINRDEMVHNVLQTLAARLSFLLPVCADASTTLVAALASADAGPTLCNSSRSSHAFRNACLVVFRKACLLNVLWPVLGIELNKFSVVRINSYCAFIVLVPFCSSQLHMMQNQTLEQRLFTRRNAFFVVGRNWRKRFPALFKTMLASV
jgi:hypothetical protein